LFGISYYFNSGCACAGRPYPQICRPSDVRFAVVENLLLIDYCFLPVEEGARDLFFESKVDAQQAQDAHPHKKTPAAIGDFGRQNLSLAGGPAVWRMRL
jgi:hypothetical protein